MSANHTSGPWEVEHIGPPRVVARDHLGQFPICDIRGWGHLTGKGHSALGLPHDQAAAIQDANARLIAAAPKLSAAGMKAWAALAWIVAYDSEDKVLARAMADLEAAIEEAGTFDFKAMRANVEAQRP